jgi:hypothetical protein
MPATERPPRNPRHAGTAGVRRNCATAPGHTRLAAHRRRTRSCSRTAAATVDLLADRFLRLRDRWFDVATAREVVVRVFGAGPRREQLAWAERCAMLATLRHPLLHTLLDYGAAGPRSLFEAFEPAEPVAYRRAAVTLAAHARRFVQAHGVAFSTALTLPPLPRQRRASAGASHGQQPDRARPASRVADPTLRAAGGMHPRPIGFVLQPRRAIATLADLVANPPAPGVTRVTLAEQSARAHLWLTADRTARGAGLVIHLDPMRATEMSSMIYRDDETGPSLDEIFRASRRSGAIRGGSSPSSARVRSRRHARRLSWSTRHPPPTRSRRQSRRRAPRRDVGTGDGSMPRPGTSARRRSARRPPRSRPAGPVPRARRRSIRSRAAPQFCCGFT